MIELIIKGIVTGFILSIMIGPVFFVLLETSIRRGVRSALAFDLGVLISDVLYILIAYIFYSEVSSLSTGEKSGIIKIVGGVIFIAYGIITYLKKIKEMKVDAVGKIIQRKGVYIMLVLKGFLLNIANPLVIFYWFSVMTLAAKSAETSGENETSSIVFFLLVILITFFSFDLLKIFGAKKLRPLVTDKLLISLNHFIGLIFVGFGIFLIVQGFMKI